MLLTDENGTGAPTTARETLRAAQSKLAAAKAATAAAREAVARGETYLVGMGAHLADARAIEQSQASERARAFALAGDVELDEPVATRRRRDIEDQIESARPAVGTLHEALAYAVEAERGAVLDVERAIGAVLCDDAIPMLAELQRLEHEAANLRASLKAFARCATMIIPGQFHIMPAGLAEHLGKDAENSNERLGWLNSFGYRKTEADVSAWRNLRVELHENADAKLALD